tara:strand:- start:171 stop:383 length:213 start_codon:yes stop_codon:yes gene_type:complete
MEPREEAQMVAEATYKGFLKFCKYMSYVIIAGLLFAASCNFGVEDGPRKTGSQYDGSVYAPDNIKVNKYD